jgi:hypothetical protein
MDIIKPMLDEDPSRRPSSFVVLQTFDKLVVSLQLQSETGNDTRSCYN